MLSVEGGDADVLVRVHPEPLLDRFPLVEPSARAAWRRAVETLTRHGTGAVVFARRSVSGAGTAGEREGAAYPALVVGGPAQPREIQIGDLARRDRAPRLARCADGRAGLTGAPVVTGYGWG